LIRCSRETTCYPSRCYRNAHKTIWKSAAGDAKHSCVGSADVLAGLDFDTNVGVLEDTFKHKGQAVIDQNAGIARAGFDYARDRFVPLGYDWNFSRTPRPFVTGNELIALGAVAAGCKFYSAYPMTPASSILPWMASHGERCGVVVKQCEDELAVANMAIGAGHAGSGGCAGHPAVVLL
jgi:2-oxoglutarate ferredoxin oxidoreductase subunit alpha